MNQSYIVAFWSPFPTPMTRFCKSCFSPIFKDYGNIQCLDCSCGRDRRTRRLLFSADLVAITVNQSHRELSSLFCRPTIPFDKCIYIVTGYVPGWGFDLEDISFEFRIPNASLACVPYCLGMSDEKGPIVKEYCYMDFDLELERASRKMLRALGF